jgi:hypothetical protein
MHAAHYLGRADQEAYGQALIRNRIEDELRWISSFLLSPSPAPKAGRYTAALGIVSSQII